MNKWRSDHQGTPFRSLFDLCPEDSIRGVHELRALQPPRRLVPRTAPGSLPPRPRPPFTDPSLPESAEPSPWVSQHRDLLWTNTPGSRGHKQIRTRFAIINHWDSGWSVSRDETPRWSRGSQTPKGPGSQPRMPRLYFAFTPEALPTSYIPIFLRRQPSPRLEAFPIATAALHLGVLSLHWHRQATSRPTMT